ncbi:hypothetical protein SAMD00019534_114480 [Acytostelium subglobosum LB1]|uniref:hypothetical protein n=1 Tax=Acytostelium subglobosum LB1 TaxID=1410327 RepID=UPI000644F831|nr:hypothetical protein SAMD00019534_114480 [Acytostelium subglobosum LB1]GAM28272.1 hypothetical protein SAMD00019534_114480 [Acytostelium subglobosum LB1]|eukprot:XP_012748906.1 hypothetical protein SAMD00019534_114480 [Acytostelium subglobosum LB1]
MPNTLQCQEDETIKFECNTFNLETRKQLHTHLIRPVGIDDDSDAFEEWASKIVRVEFPSPLLETGIEIIDVPGFSKSDQASLFSIRKQFFNVYKPTGILFCYPNTFSDAEVLAVKDLNESLPGNWSKTSEYFFFANTKTSKSEVATNNNIGQGEDVPLELIDSHSVNCFSKVKSSSISTPMCVDQRRFGIVNALDFIKQPRSVENRYIFKQFINRLIRWMIRLFQCQSIIISKIIFQECHFMTIKVISFSKYIGNDKDFGRMLQEANVLVDTYSKNLGDAVSKIIDTIPSVIKSAFAQESNQLIIQSAHDNITNTSNNVNDPKPMKYIIEDIIKLALNPIDRLINNEIHSLTDILLYKNSDIVQELLNNAMEANTSDSVHKKDVVHHLFGSIKSAISPYEGIMRHFKEPKMVWSEFNTQIRKYPETISIRTMKRNAVQVVQGNISRFKVHIKRHHDILGHIVRASTTLNNNIDTSLPKYISLFNDMYALRSHLLLPFDLKVDRSKVVARGTIGPVYKGSFRNKSFMVQVVNFAELPLSYQFELTKQVMSGYNVAKGIPIIPLHSMFKQHCHQQQQQQQNGVGDIEEWLLVYKKQSPLLPYLEKNISTMSITQSMTMINQLAKALEYLQDESDPTHYRFRLESIYINPSTKDIYLAKFGYVEST